MKEPPSESGRQEKAEKKKRKRKIIWFSPPYSKNVQTNVGKISERSERKVVYHCFTQKYNGKVLWETHLVFVSFCVRLLQL